MNGEKYRAMLTELRVIEELDDINGAMLWMFQDDGAMPHRSKETRDWLNERCLNVSNRAICNWPAYSPDLNLGVSFGQNNSCPGQNLSILSNSCGRCSKAAST
jgi:hypothetical protein